MTEQTSTLIVGFRLYGAVNLLDFFGSAQVFSFAAGGAAIRLEDKLEGRVMANKADLSIQYAPGPPVTLGDPSPASNEVVASVTETQLTTFIKPISDVTDKVISQQ